MAWVEAILQAENGSAVQLLTITICLVVLLILITWIFKKIAGTAARKKARNRIPRLSVTDWANVGEKHQLVLVRRDNVEHLLLIGGNSDIVVENNIVRVQAAAKPLNGSATTETSAAVDVKPDAVKEVEPEGQSVTKDVIAPVAAVTAAATATIAMAETKEEPPVITTESAVADLAIEEPDIDTDAVNEAVQKITEGIEGVDITATEPAVEEDVKVEADVAAADESSDVELDVEAPADSEEFESELIASISGPIEDNAETVEVTNGNGASEAVEAVEITDTETDSSNGDDEMQRLLDELATETKETVEAGAKEPA